MRWKLLFAGFALVGACQAAQAGYIDSEGKDWLALDPTMGASWSEIAAACDPISGVCDGVFSGPYFAPFNVTGYTWATADEVRDLFIELGDLPAGTLDSYDVSFGAFLYRTPAYAVPEPSTPALMVAGLIAAVLCRRGRRRLERG